MLTACGGGAGSDAPTDADAGEFCSTYAELFAIEDPSGIGDLVDRMVEVGTPSDMSEEQRSRFELFVDTAGDIDEDTDLEELEEQELEGDDADAATAFGEYVGANCAEQLQGTISEELGDLPTDLPSEPETE